VIEAQGRQDSIGTAVRIARKGGRIVITGIVVGDRALDVVDLVVGEKQVMGSIQHEREADLRPALALMADGSIRVEPLITGEIPLNRVVSDGLEALAATERRHVKLLVRNH
jgi:threonine dehydrogenase-like Zn-dependent dehydrogenase